MYKASQIDTLLTSFANDMDRCVRHFPFCVHNDREVEILRATAMETVHILGKHQ